MGDKLLKTLFLLLLVSSAFLYANTSRNWIDKMVADIKPDRPGLNANLLQGLKNPFVQKVSKQKTGTTQSVRYKRGQKKTHKHFVTKFKLMATLNSSAKINNRWYKLNQKIGKFTLRKITKNYVILKKNKNMSIKVNLNRSKNHLKMTVK